MLNGKDVIDCSSGGYTAGNYILVACGLCTECEMQYNECNGGSSKWSPSFILRTGIISTLCVFIYRK